MCITIFGTFCVVSVLNYNMKFPNFTLERFQIVSISLKHNPKFFVRMTLG